MNDLLQNLSRAIRSQEETTEFWDEIFSSATMKTEFNEDEKKTIGKIFRQIKISEKKTMLIHEFLSSVQKAILAHPIITRRVLEQMLPVGSFRKSIHKYSNLSKIAPFLDYVHYLVFGPPTSKFQKQLSQYSIPQDIITRLYISIPQDTSILQKTYLQQRNPTQDIVLPQTNQLKIPKALIRKPRRKQEPIQTIQYLGQR